MKLRIKQCPVRKSVFWVQKYDWLGGWQAYDNLEFKTYEAAFRHAFNIKIIG